MPLIAPPDAPLALASDAVGWPDDPDDPRLARARRRLARLQDQLEESIYRYSPAIRPAERPAAPSQPIARGIKSGSTLGWAPDSEMVPRSPLGVEADVGLLGKLGYGAGYFAGSIPAALLTAAATTAGAGALAPALATRLPGVARVLSYLSRPVTSAGSSGRVAMREALRGGATREAARAAGQEAARAATRQAVAQNVAQGLTYSAATEPIRKLPPGVSRAESMALSTGFGAGIDAGVGLLLGRYGRAAATPLRGGRRRLRGPAPEIPAPDAGSPAGRSLMDRPSGALPTSAEVATRRANELSAPFRASRDMSYLEELAARRMAEEGAAETPLILSPQGVPVRTGAPVDIEVAPAARIRARTPLDEEEIARSTRARLLPPPDRPALPPPDQTARESMRIDPVTGEVLEETSGGPLIRPGEPGQPYVPPPDRPSEPMLWSAEGGIARRVDRPPEPAPDPRLERARARAERVSVEEPGEPRVDVVETPEARPVTPEPDVVEPEVGPTLLDELREEAQSLRPTPRGIVISALEQDSERGLMTVASDLANTRLTDAEAETVAQILTRRQEELRAVARPEPEVRPGLRGQEAGPDRWPLREQPEGFDGRETTLTFADGTKLRARYRLVEAESLTPSHDPQTFQPNEAYPPRGNSRQYQLEDGRVARQESAARQEAYDPDYPLDPTQHVVHGPPATRGDDVVVSGNQRTMDIQERYRQGRADDYRQRLRERAAEFGVTPEAVDNMRQPVLVREIADDAVDVEDVQAFQRLNRSSDIQPGKGKDAISRAQGRVAQLENAERSLEHFAQTFPEDQTLRSYLRTAEGRKLGSLLEEEGVLSPDEKLRDINGNWNEDGLDEVEMMFQVWGIGDPDLTSVARGNIKGMVNQLEHAFPAIARAAQTSPEWDIRPTLQEALNLHVELAGQPREAAIKDIEGLVRPGHGQQTSMLARDESLAGVRLAKFLEEANKTETNLAFRHYTKLAREANRQLESDDLFGWNPISADEAFKKAFGKVREVRRVEGPALREGSSEAGFATAALLRPMVGGVVGGAVGGAQGDTPGEHAYNAVLGAVIGAMGASLAPSLVRSFKPAGGMSYAESFGRTADKMAMQAHDYIRNHGGAAGIIVADDIQSIDFRASRRRGVMFEDIRAVYRGLGRDDQLMIGKILNGKASAAGASSDLVERANRLREILDRDLNDYRALGGERLVRGEWETPEGSGKAFPQLPNREGSEALDALKNIGTSDARVQQLAADMVDEGLAADFDEAIERLAAYRAKVIDGGDTPQMEWRRVGFNTNLMSTRMELPEAYVDWSPQALRGVIERNAMTIEGMRKWGPNHVDLRPFLAQIRHDAGADVYNTIDTYLKHEFGVGGLEDKATTQILGAWNNLETLTRLSGPLSAQLNYGQQFTNLSHLPLKAQLKALKAYPPFINRWMKEATELRQWAERGGHVRGRSALADLHGAPGQSAAETIIAPFLSVVRSNEVRTAIAARFALEADLERIMVAAPEQTSGIRGFIDTLAGRDVRAAAEGGLEGAPVRRLERLGLSQDNLAEIIASGERLTEDQLHQAAYRLVHDTQFPMTLASKQIWWSTNPALRLLFKFKTFGLRQTGYIYENVVREAMRGNVAPLAKFTATTILMGELYHISRDLLLGSDRSITVHTFREGELPEDIAGRLWTNFYIQGGVGMLMDLQYGIGDWIGGPAVSTLQTLGEAASGISTEAIRALETGDLGALPRGAGAVAGQWADEQLPAWRQFEGMAHRLEQSITEEHKPFFDYQTAREQAFRFHRQQQSITERAQAGIERTLRGFPEYEIGRNTVPLQSAGGALQTGNVEKAARHMEAVLTAADTEQSGISSIRNSMRSRGPMGGLTEPEREAFLFSLPLARRQEILDLQFRWESDTESALNMAIRSLYQRR